MNGPVRASKSLRVWQGLQKGPAQGQGGGDQSAEAHLLKRAIAADMWIEEACIARSGRGGMTGKWARSEGVWAAKLLYRGSMAPTVSR